MSYSSHMQDKHPHVSMEEYLEVFIDFRRNLLNLMAVQKLKKNFEIFFWTLTNYKIFVNCQSQYWQNPVAFYWNFLF